jgi:AraC-like DNA-binding protein
VRRFWITTAASTEAALPTARSLSRRVSLEHSLPTGDMHLVVRLSDEPVRLFEASHDVPPRAFGHAVVGGVRSSFYSKEMPAAVTTIGVEFHPSACDALLGVAAADLTGRHATLSDLWKPSVVDALRDRLSTTIDLETRIDILERAIVERMPRVQGVHPAVALALDRFRTLARVDVVVKESGYSHRTFSDQFRRTMGLGPKTYLRLLRMRRLIERIGMASWADLAADAGFSDQAHFAREFRTFTGVTPTAFVRARRGGGHHFRILQDGRDDGAVQCTHDSRAVRLLVREKRGRGPRVLQTGIRRH